MTEERRTRAVVLAWAMLAVLGSVLVASDSEAGSVAADNGLEVLRGARVMHVYKAHHQQGRTLLSYHGGLIQTAPMVYLVYWGSQWSNDPSGQVALQKSFFQGVGSSSWNNSVTQYCEGVSTGATQCAAAGTHVGNQPAVLAGVWFDNANAAPIHPTQSQIAAEAVKAAAHFGLTTNIQFVVNTASGNNSTGFGSQYCAYHSSASSTLGEVAYTYMPYITDAGASCGANFNGLGAKAGITIVGGHEFAESETDPYPSTGWVDGSGAENGDKCAWVITGSQGAAADITLSTGSFPVQSLWSNGFNGGTGGCVLSYP
jgi:serine protease